MNKGLPIKTTGAVFAILESIVESQEVTVSELAGQLEMPVSTVHNHVSSLERLDYLIREDGKYRLSSKFLEMGNRSRNRMDIYRKGRQPLEALADETGEFTLLMYKEEIYGVVLDIVQGRRVSDVEIRGTHPGTRTELHTTANGKAILAALPEEEAAFIVEQGLVGRTPNTITNCDELTAQLVTIRDQGYAIDRGERMLGMHGISVSIVPEPGRVTGAISIYGPSNHFDDRMLEDELAGRLQQVVNEIEVNLNYS